MATAQILVNAVVGSNDNLPINTLIQLDNATVETTYTWTLLDRPKASSAVLSNPAIKNPTLTPDCEGTYLLRLVINLALADEVQDSVICAVRSLKTLRRVPAAGETVEDSASRGWANDQEDVLLALDSLAADTGRVVGYADQAGLQAGNVLYVSTVATIKAGLPGVEQVPAFARALATMEPDIRGLLGVLEGGVDGSAAPALGALIVVRLLGMSKEIALAGAVLRDPVYLSDTGTLSLTPGTNRRQIGVVCWTNAVNMRVFIVPDLRQESWVLTRAANPAVLSFAAASTAAGLTHYLYPCGVLSATSTTERAVRVPRAGRLRNMYVRATSATHDRTVALTVRVNGGDTSMFVGLAAATQHGQDTTNDAVVAVGDRVSIKVVTDAAQTVSYADLYVTMEVIGE